MREDDGERIDAVLDDLDTTELRAFLRDELARDDAMLDRFFAEFDATSGKSREAYRDDVAQMFEEHTSEYSVVVDEIDFSQFTDIAEQYQNQGRTRQAAAVYRGLVSGIDDNIELVDGAYDHYASVSRDSLDAFVECVTAADLSSSEYEAYEQFLRDRIESGSPIHRAQFERALSNLQDIIEE